MNTKVKPNVILLYRDFYIQEYIKVRFFTGFQILGWVGLDSPGRDGPARLEIIGLFFADKIGVGPVMYLFYQGRIIRFYAGRDDYKIQMRPKAARLKWDYIFIDILVSQPVDNSICSFNRVRLMFNFSNFGRYG